jgi:hypothetical protein
MTDKVIQGEKIDGIEEVIRHLNENEKGHYCV